MFEIGAQYSVYLWSPGKDGGSITGYHRCTVLEVSMTGSKSSTRRRMPSCKRQSRPKRRVRICRRLSSPPFPNCGRRLAAIHDRRTGFSLQMTPQEQRRPSRLGQGRCAFADIRPARSARCGRRAEAERRDGA
jgi:hypothetical protein